MSDLAVLDLETQAPAARAKSFAVVGPFRKRDAGTDATLSALLSAVPGTPAAIAGPAPLEHSDITIDLEDKRSVNRVLSDVEAVIVVAPTFGSDIATASSLAKIAYRARLRGQTVAFVAASAAQGAGSATRWLTRNAIHSADLTILRDEASADALVAGGVEPPLRIGADPAWSELGDLFAARKQADHVVVALDDRTSPALVNQISEALAPVAASGFEVLLQPWSNPSGAAVAERVADRIGNNVSVIDAPSNLREARDVYSTSRAVLALRFHAVMAAACAGSRTLAFGDAAMARLATSLDLPLVPSSSDPQDIAAALLRTLEHGPVGSRAVPQLVDRAKASIDLVRLLLTEGEDISQSANNPLPLYPNPWRS